MFKKQHGLNNNRGNVKLKHKALKNTKGLVVVNFAAAVVGNFATVLKQISVHETKFPALLIVVDKSGRWNQLI